MKLKYKNVLVYGLSCSGEWASKLLIKHKANVFLYDDNSERLKSRALKGCYVLQGLNESLIADLDFIVVSPSIESDNIYLKMAANNNIKIYSELEFASHFIKNYFALTGTNGKTTTVQLIRDILNKKHKAIACGNIGLPLSRAVMENKGYLKVIEVSSFMLEHAKTFSPKVASVLNISPDHLIRHKTMEEYSKLKMNIFNNLKPTEYAVLNLDNKINPQKNCINVTYSYNKYADVYVKNGYIYAHTTKIMAINEIPLKGKHNVYNVMCAICYGLIYKVKANKIRQAILEFKPDKFRIENVATVKGINFVNDSKSTNIESTLASAETIKGSIVLLLGGSNKELDYTMLFEKLSKRVKQIVVYGEIAETLAKANNNKFNCEVCIDLNQAFDFATTIAKQNDTILLSPASASYDQYANYLERGNAFNLKVFEYEKTHQEK